MTNQDHEQDIDPAVSEQNQVESQDTQEGEQKMVPLSAMLATRKKLQEADVRTAQAEAKAQLYHEHLMRLQEDKQRLPEEEEDPKGLVEKHVLKETTASTKREILETLYQDMNPAAVQQINKYLKPILDKKPWLAASVDSAQNRYARAHEIVQDYLHLVEEKPVEKKPINSDGHRIIQNAQKPRSPAEVGKSAQPGGMDYLKSIQGKKEFREYRNKLLHG